MVTYHIEVNDGRGIVTQYLWTFPKSSDENIHKIAIKFLRKNTRISATIYQVLPKSKTGLQKMMYLGMLSYTWGGNNRPSKVWGFRVPGNYWEDNMRVWDSKSKKFTKYSTNQFFDKYVE